MALNHKSRKSWLALAATAGLVAQLSGCGGGAASTPAAPAYNADGSPIGSQYSSATPTPYPNNYSNGSGSSFDPLNPSLPNDPNNLGGNFPSASPLPSGSTLPGASASPLPGSSPEPLPSFAPPFDLSTPGSGLNSQLTGFGTKDLKAPLGIALSAGKVYVVDSDSLIANFGKHGEFDVFDASNGKFLNYYAVTTKTLGFIPTGVLPSTITGIAVGGSNVYISDPAKGIYVYDLSYKFVRNQAAGGITAITASASTGSVFTASTGGIKKYNSALSAATFTLNGASIQSPAGLAVDGSENLFVTDASSRRVLKFDANGNKLMEFDGKGSDGSGQGFAGVGALGVDPRNGDIYVIDTGAGTVRKFDRDGKYKSSFGTLSSPRGIAIDTDGTIYVSDNASKTIEVFTAG